MAIDHTHTDVEGAVWKRQQAGVEMTKRPHGMEGEVTGPCEIVNAASAADVVAHTDATHESSGVAW